MMQMLGGNGMIGEISQYHKETVRYTENKNYLSVNNPFNSALKFARITCTEEPTDYGAIIHLICDDVIGCELSLNWSNGSNNYSYMKYVTKENGNLSNSEYLLYDGKYRFGRPSSSYFWAKDTDYIVELYA